MRKYSCQIFIDILLLIGVVYLFSMCTNSNKSNNITEGPYEINHYIDTINNHIILTSVCYYPLTGYVSVNTLELKD